MRYRMSANILSGGAVLLSAPSVAFDDLAMRGPTSVAQPVTLEREVSLGVSAIDNKPVFKRSEAARLGSTSFLVVGRIGMDMLQAMKELSQLRVEKLH